MFCWKPTLVLFWLDGISEVQGLTEKIWEDPDFLSGDYCFFHNVIVMVKISDPKFSFYSINICDYVSPQNWRLASASNAKASSRTQLQALNRFTAYKKQTFTRPEAVFLPQTETMRLLLSCQHQFVSNVSKLPGPTFDPQPPPSHDANLKRKRAKNGNRNVLQSGCSMQICSYHWQLRSGLWC